MVLKLRIRICYKNKCVESVGIANSGFTGREPEITIPEYIARELLGEGVTLTLVDRLLADGSRVSLARTVEPLNLYLVAEDRIEGPIKVYAYIIRGRFILLNDSVLSTLRVVIIDPWKGIWCFRDELGKKERKGV